MEHQGDRQNLGHATKFFHIFMSPSVSVEAIIIDNPYSYMILQSTIVMVNICMGSQPSYAMQSREVFDLLKKT